MKLRSRSSPESYERRAEVLSAGRRAAVAVTALLFLALGVGGQKWAFLVVGGIAVLFAVAEFWFAWRKAQAGKGAALRALLDGQPCHAGNARASEYGVDAEVLPEGQQWRYVHRDFEGKLREAIKRALSGEGARLVMLCGETKAGKTRAAFQALRWEELRDAHLVVPREGASVEALLADGALPASWTPLVIWLDDIERYASVDASGLHPGTLRNLHPDRPVLLLATEGGRGRARYAKDSELVDPVKQLRDLAVRVEVPVGLSEGERSRAQDIYGEQFAAESEQVGLGRRMVAVDELRGKLTSGRRDPTSEPCREGVAVIRAVIDWRRMGAQSSFSVEQIDSLYRHYLPDDLDPSAQLLDAGLKWARDPVPKTEISLLSKASDGQGRFEPYDLAVQIAAGEWPDIDEQTVAQIVSIAAPLDCFQMATAAYESNNVELALPLLGRAESSADQRLSAISAFNLGQLLREERGDLDGAEAAYRRADERGHAAGAFNLGNLLRERGDLEGAEAAYRRADVLGVGTEYVGSLVEAGDRGLVAKR